MQKGILIFDPDKMHISVLPTNQTMVAQAKVTIVIPTPRSLILLFIRITIVVPFPRSRT